MKAILLSALIALSLSSAAFAEMVNINTADAATISKNLKGIGAKKAEAIIAYRTEHGPFKATADLKEVKGIGDGLFKKIEADLSIGDSAVPSSATNTPATPVVTAPATKNTTATPTNPLVTAPMLNTSSSDKTPAISDLTEVVSSTVKASETKPVIRAKIKNSADIAPPAAAEPASSSDKAS